MCSKYPQQYVCTYSDQSVHRSPIVGWPKIPKEKQNFAKASSLIYYEFTKKDLELKKKTFSEDSEL